MRPYAMIRSKKVWGVSLAACILFWLAWPRGEAISRKGSSLAGDSPQTPVNTLVATPSRPETRPSRAPLNVLADDSLDDFVIDKGDHYGAPETRDELERAIKSGKAMRKTAYFAQRFGYTDAKPFYGDLPTRLCNSMGGLRFEPNRFQLRKNFRLVDVYLKTPTQPQVSIVAAAGITNAQQARYFEEPPITYQFAEYWAVVYAGTSGSSPAAYLLDRVTIGEKEAEFVIDRPRNGAETCDVHPYWFYIPLGHLPDGPYKVVVRNASTGGIDSVTTATLRRATKQENEARNSELGKEYAANSAHYEKRRKIEQEHGAAMQLRLERLAEFVHESEETDRDHRLLSQDVTRLGERVDWDMNIYQSPQRDRRALELATPGKTPPLLFTRNRWDSEQTPWGPSDIPLKSVWMCDGTDAPWFAGTNYLHVPALDDALRDSDPTTARSQIKEIWRSLQQNFGRSRADEHLVKERVRSVAVAGKDINEAIEAAYEVIVEGKPRQLDFSPNDEMWCVFVAERSFLIRGVSFRQYVEKYRKHRRKDYMINCSAYIGLADGVPEESCAPVTLAIIPLGKPGDVDSVGVSFACHTICCRQLGDKNELLDFPLRNTQWHSEIGNRIRGPAGFRVTRNAEGEKAGK